MIRRDETENEMRMRRVLLCPLSWKKSDAAVFSLLNAVEEEKQGSLAPVEQNSLVPVDDRTSGWAGVALGRLLRLLRGYTTAY